MDVHLLYGRQRFVWNAEKAAANERKHGVRFETACEVFFDSLVRFEEAGVEDEAGRGRWIHRGLAATFRCSPDPGRRRDSNYFSATGNGAGAESL